MSNSQTNKEYDFYQKINFAGNSKLVFVGKEYVPDNSPRWKFAPKVQPKIGKMEDITNNPPRELFETIDYDRVKTITGIIYVANVDVKLI